MMGAVCLLLLMNVVGYQWYDVGCRFVADVCWLLLVACCCCGVLVVCCSFVGWVLVVCCVFLAVGSRMSVVCWCVL